MNFLAVHSSSSKFISLAFGGETHDVEGVITLKDLHLKELHLKEYISQGSSFVMGGLLEDWVHHTPGS